MVTDDLHGLRRRFYTKAPVTQATKAATAAKDDGTISITLTAGAEAPKKDKAVMYTTDTSGTERQ